MIKLSNGFQFQFMAASGSLGFDGRGWWHPKYWVLRWILLRRPDLLLPITKTLTLDPVKGQPRAIYDGEDFTVNAVALWNPGIKEWAKRYLPGIKTPVIISITERGIVRVNALASEVAGFRNRHIVGIEFNASCPNVDKAWTPRDVEKACRFIKKRLDLPLGLKIGYHQAYIDIARKTQGLVEWLNFNAILWELVFPGKESPLFKKFGVNGAVSGAAIRELNKKMALEIERAGVKTPVVASSTGWGRNFQEGYEDLLEAFKWADAVSFGSLFRRHPTWPLKMILRYKKEV